MKQVYLHLGYPRTGTTSLQHNVFVRHPELAYLGKPLHYWSAKLAKFLTVLMERPESEWAAGREELISGVVEPLLARKPQEKLVISEEELSTGRISGVDRLVIARRLKELFPEARVLVTLRRQEEAIASLYCHLRAERMIPAVDFSAWLEGQRGAADNVVARLDYLGLLERYADLFGADRIFVQRYEDLARDPRAYLRSLSSFIGIDARTTIELFEDPTRDTHRNRRTSGIDTTYLDEHRAWIQDATAGGNAQVAQRFGVQV